MFRGALPGETSAPITPTGIAANDLKPHAVMSEPLAGCSSRLLRLDRDAIRLSQARIARLTCSAIGSPVLSLIVCKPSINSGSSPEGVKRLGGVTTEALYIESYTFFQLC